MVTVADLQARIVAIDKEIGGINTKIRAYAISPSVGLPAIAKLEAEKAALVKQIADLTAAAPAPALSGASFSATLREMGAAGPAESDAGRAAMATSGVTNILASAGLTVEKLKELHKSPADRAAIATLATSASTIMQVGLGLLYSVGVVAEVASLGQVETVIDLIDEAVKNTGVDEILKSVFLAPFRAGVFTPTSQYWRSMFPNEIPASMDLITFVVREVISPADFKKWMAYQGFSSAWSDAYWEAHWRLPARDEVVEAYHRGHITKAEYDKYIVWLDYKPTKRPGIAKSDLEILTGLMKTLIPRVDLRRAWELGKINDARLLKGYTDLGFEDDAALMAEIQKAISLSSERSAIARAAGRCYRDGKIPESRFREVLTEMLITGEAQNLWILRYQWEKIAGAPSAAESAEELTKPPEE